LSKRFTILIIPEGSHRVRRSALKLSALKWSAVGVACCVLLMIGLAGYAVKAGFDRHDYERLR
jgi:hypothetical protein